MRGELSCIVLILYLALTICEDEGEGCYLELPGSAPLQSLKLTNSSSLVTVLLAGPASSSSSCLLSLLAVGGGGAGFEYGGGGSGYLATFNQVSNPALCCHHNHFTCLLSDCSPWSDPAECQCGTGEDAQQCLCWR